MNKIECIDLLEEVAAIDNRKITEETINAWLAVLSHIPLEIAREALRLARKDERVNWLEPRHIVSWSREAAYKLDRASGRNIPEEPLGNFAPQPKCKAHHKGIMTCDACCKKMSVWADLPPAQILMLAREHIYA